MRPRLNSADASPGRGLVEEPERPRKSVAMPAARKDLAEFDHRGLHAGLAAARYSCTAFCMSGRRHVARSIRARFSWAPDSPARAARSNHWAAMRSSQGRRGHGKTQAEVILRARLALLRRACRSATRRAQRRCTGRRGRPGGNRPRGVLPDLFSSCPVHSICDPRYRLRGRESLYNQLL
jgi:hypothetical protein